MVLKSVFVVVQNRLRISRRLGIVLGSNLAPVGLPKCVLLAPFWRPKSIKKTIRNRTALKVAPRSPQERPRRSQDAPRTPPGPPKRPPGPPPDAQEALPDPLGRPKTFSESSGPITFFGKIEKFEIVEKKVEKKRSTTVIHSGYPHWSSQKPKALSKRSNTEGGGGGRAKRSSISKKL